MLIYSSPNFYYMLQSIFFLPLRRTLGDSQCLSIGKINRILIELMIKIPLWGKYCLVLWSLLIIVSLLLSWFLLVERDQRAQPPRALSTGDWWQSSSNHDAPSKWFGGHFGSFLSNYHRRTLWNICAFSHTIFLSLAQPYFLATCLCASFTLFATE